MQVCLGKYLEMYWTLAHLQHDVVLMAKGHGWVVFALRTRPWKECTTTTGNERDNLAENMHEGITISAPENAYNSSPGD